MSVSLEDPAMTKPDSRYGLGTTGGYNKDKLLLVRLLMHLLQTLIFYRALCTSCLVNRRS